MNASFSRIENVTSSSISDNGIPEIPMYLTVAGIELEVSSFQVGKLSIQCEAQVFQFESRRRIILDEERPQLASVLGTRASGAGEWLVHYNSGSIIPQNMKQVKNISKLFKIFEMQVGTLTTVTTLSLSFKYCKTLMVSIFEPGQTISHVLYVG